jgi:hypothetical protein
MNMMTFSPLPEFLSIADVDRLLSLIKVLANPDASKTLLEQMSAARDAAQVKIDDAAIRGARIEAAELVHAEKLKRECEEHANSLATAQTTFNQACAEREKDLQAREAVAQDVKREADKLMKEAQAMKADLDRRLEAIRGAAL